MVVRNQSSEEKTTFVLLFARNQPSCDVSYLMAKSNNSLYPMLLSTTFYFLRDLTNYRAIALNNSVYIMGGRYASTGRLSCSVFKYDADIDSWRVCDSMKAPRVHFAVTAVNGKIYVVGGEGLKGVTIQTVEAYDPTVDRWKEVGILTKPRRYHATCTVNEKLWSCGGASSLLEAQTTNELVTLDPRPDEWKRSVAIFTLPEPRQQHCLIAINNTALLVGGCERNGDAVRNIHQISQVVPRSLEIMPEWKEFDARLQHPRTDCGQFQLGEFLYIIGGHDGETGKPTKMIERIEFNADNRSINIEEQFEIDRDLSCVDCCVVQTNQFNQHLLPLASYLDHWIVW